MRWLLSSVLMVCLWRWCYFSRTCDLFMLFYSVIVNVSIFFLLFVIYCVLFYAIRQSWEDGIGKVAASWDALLEHAFFFDMSECTRHSPMEASLQYSTTVMAVWSKRGHCRWKAKSCDIGDALHKTCSLSRLLRLLCLLLSNTCNHYMQRAIMSV